MMAKVKKVSINAFEKAVKECHENTVVAEWNGLEVVITHTISLQDMMNLVAEVADNCFLDDGRYIPEMMQPLLDCGVVERYTNISLPSNLAARYELVMKSGIMDFIMPKINSNQYSDIVVAIRDKVDYACDSNTAEFNRAIDNMMESINAIQESTKNLFENVSPDDIRKIVGVVGDERRIEERIVDEYIKKKNEGLKIVGDE